MKTLSVLLPLVLLVGCEDGRSHKCKDASECPPGTTCSRGLCVDVDAGASDAGVEEDAGQDEDAGEAVDASSPDAGSSTYAILGKISGAANEVTIALSGAASTSTTVDGDGEYRFDGLASGDYTITPQGLGYVFTPSSRSATVVDADVSGQDFTVAPAVATQSIFGTVSGAVASGVTVTLSGDSTATATTDANGNFSFSGLLNGSYSLTPSLAGFTFAPASRSVTISDANLTGQDFTAARITYSLSGSVSGAVASGVTVALSGDSTATLTTDANGNFSFSEVAPGSYTLTPSLAGFTFTPASRSVTISGANLTGQSFAATRITNSISGSVSGAVTLGVTLTLSGGSNATTTTDANGNFSFSGITPGSYTLTPSRSGYSFSPASLSVIVSSVGVTGLSFTSTLITYGISGSVSGPVGSGVTVTLSGNSTATTTTDANGNFSFSGVAPGSYTLTPSRSGYSFSPASRSVTVSGANVTGLSFTSALITYSISGYVSGAVASGVTLTLSGGSTATTTTDANGNFSFSGVAPGSYTLVPSRSGYSFSPASRSVTVSAANVTGQNFTSTANRYTISGRITGGVAGGIEVGLSGASNAQAVTDGNGNFTFSAIPVGSYTVTPSLSGRGFSPTSRAVTLSTTDVTGVDFVFSPGNSGTLTIDSVALSSTIVQLNGESPYMAAITNRTSSVATDLAIQNWVVQGSARRAAGGAVLTTCGAQTGSLNVGTCQFSFGLYPSNDNSGIGALGPGSATGVVHLQQSGRVIYEYAIPITLN